ncbi:extracellular catalytic domain type 2 short-chain-length polyhydroxyalkanoate depolymerase [Pseudoalteromonas piscicida]|uniref:extracellular catalytic domain type 2 short-chain-length polyhydroxyalkanoate depolymerase n=1 Tax=Pseudoalteromonas piscicida TaxID=43662 RepID=UPI0030AC05B5
MKNKNKLIGLGTLFVALSGCTEKPPTAELTLNLDLSQTTVSGLSSGAYMAHQLHIAYSDKITGAALLAGGPYGCAKGDLDIALAECMTAQSELNISPFVQIAKQAEQQGTIASLENLKSQPVWVYHGKSDTRVGEWITKASADLYQALGATPTYIDSIDSGHGFPTESSGVTCNTTAEPHINHCQYDAAGELLTHLYGELKPKVVAQGKIHPIDQNQFINEGQENTLADTGYLYVPKSCAQGESCRVHIALHGCKQNEEALDKQYVENTGYNSWADNNRLVILYPQTKNSLSPLNPYGCWDWWGYTGADYQTRSGAQLSHIINMVEGLSQP